MLVNTALRSVSRAGARRPMSTATPKMHKAKDVWGELKATRPPEGHAHVSRHIEFNFGSSLICYGGYSGFAVRRLLRALELHIGFGCCSIFISGVFELLELSLGRRMAYQRLSST